MIEVMYVDSQHLSVAKHKLRWTSSYKMHLCMSALQPICLADSIQKNNLHRNQETLIHRQYYVIIA